VDHPQARSLLPDGKKIILSLGSVQRRKNLASLPDVFRLLQADFLQGKWIFVRCGEFLPLQLEQKIREVIGTENFFQLGHRYGDEVVSLFQAA
jgi:hypothetical protein